MLKKHKNFKVAGVSYFMVNYIDLSVVDDEGMYRDEMHYDEWNEEYIDCINSFDITIDCLEDKFIEGDLDDDECYGEGRPIIVVPKNWPPREWLYPDPPRSAVIYLDDLITFENGYMEKKRDTVTGIEIDPLTEIQNILSRFPNYVNNITVFGSYWAAVQIFDMVHYSGSKVSKRVDKFISSLTLKCAFKFVITRGERKIRKVSVSKFICY